MRKTLIVSTILLCSAVGVLAASAKAIKSTRVSDYQLIISCANGRTPTTANVSGSLVISCEGRQE